MDDRERGAQARDAANLVAGAPVIDGPGAFWLFFAVGFQRAPKATFVVTLLLIGTILAPIAALLVFLIQRL